MEKIILSEIRLNERRISIKTKRMNSLFEELKSIDNIEDIVKFGENKIKDLKELHQEIENIKEQNNTLCYILENK